MGLSFESDAFFPSDSSSDDEFEFICVLAMYYYIIQAQLLLNGESTDSESPSRSNSDSAEYTKRSKMGDKSRTKAEKHVEDAVASSCRSMSVNGDSSKKRCRHRHRSDDKDSSRENERMTEKRVKQRERRREKLRREGKKSRVYEYESSGVGSSRDGDVLERAEDDPESVLRDMFTEFPRVGNVLFQLLQMVDDGQAVNIRGISERSLIKHIRRLFLSLRLKEDGDRVFLLPEKACPTLEVVGPLIHSLMELKEQQPVSESGVQLVAVDGGCGQEIFENLLSMPSCVEDDSNAPKGRIIGPEMPSVELLAAAKFTKAEDELREAELEKDNEISIGPSPPLAVVVEAASSNDVDGFEEVQTDSIKSMRKAKNFSTSFDTIDYQRELIRFKKEKLERDIMNMDTSKLSPMQAAYFHERQLEILEGRRTKK